MSIASQLINLCLSGFLIVGIYQFYFWCQRNTLFAARELGLPLDERIPYSPGWVWIYSFLYYPVILYLNANFRSAQEFTQVAASFLLLLALQSAFFLLFPVRTPDHWRAINLRRTLSERFLAFVQRFDASNNSFPSMHTSVATLTALHLYSHLGILVFAFPALIGVSCLLTKQHYLVDVPAGAGLGWFVYHVYQQLA